MDKGERVAEVAEADVSGEGPAAKEAERAAKEDQPERQPLPPGWCWATLGSILKELITGPFGSALHKHDYSSSGVLVVNPSIIQEGKILKNNGPFVSTEIARKLSKYTLLPGDVVIGRRGEMGRSAVSKPSQPAAICGTGSMIIRPMDIIDSEFLSQAIRGRASRKYLQAASVGTTMSNLNRRVLQSLAIPLPPLAEQKRIVARIDALFATVEAGERAIAAALADLARYRKSLLKAAVTGDLTADWRAQQPSNAEDVETGDALLERVLIAREAAWEAAELAKLKAKDKPLPATEKAVQKFRARYKPPAAPKTDDLPTLPDSWAWATVDQATRSFTNGLSKRPGSDPTDFPILRISAVRNMSVNEKDVRYYNPKSSAEVRHYWVRKGDLLFTRYNGSAELVGVCGMYRSSEPRLHPDKLMKAVLVADNLMLPDWVEIAANAGHSAFFIASCVKTSAGQHGIAGEDVKRAPIPLPPLAEQREIVSRVEAALSRADAVEASLKDQAKAAKALKQSILKAAFAGKLVPQDPTDEPAAQMLERVKAAAR